MKAKKYLPDTEKFKQVRHELSEDGRMFWRFSLEHREGNKRSINEEFWDGRSEPGGIKANIDGHLIRDGADLGPIFKPLG
jgi:hypothetical protein